MTQIPAAEHSLQAITNYLSINPLLGTGGQPARDQFAALRAAGYQVVINLVPPASSEMLPDEGDIVTQQGMIYVHIPVIWDMPTRENLEDFFATMQMYQQRKVFVHCVLNMRVSVFVFLYRVIQLHEPIERARLSLARIWEPNPTWQQFINQQFSRA